jgi:hypothetical protein
METWRAGGFHVSIVAPPIIVSLAAYNEGSRETPGVRSRLRGEREVWELSHAQGTGTVCGFHSQLTGLRSWNSSLLHGERLECWLMWLARTDGTDPCTGPREVMGAMMQWQRWATKKQGGSTQNGACVVPNPLRPRALLRAVTCDGMARVTPSDARTPTVRQHCCGLQSASPPRASCGGHSGSRWALLTGRVVLRRRVLAAAVSSTVSVCPSL